MPVPGPNFVVRAAAPNVWPWNDPWKTTMPGPPAAATIGDAPAVLAWQFGQQAQHELPGSMAGLHPGEPSRHPPEEPAFRYPGSSPATVRYTRR
jgi:hypothetical protein